jgi:AcrR family transcriptional regulator
VSGRPEASRPYRSSLREQRAAQTRARLLTAAQELFASDGFSGTTIAAIAGRAGVSVQTFYAVFGSKAKVARAIVEQMEESADAAAWRARIAAEQEPREILGAFAEWTRAFFAASMPQLLTAREVTVEMQELAAEGNARRRAGLTTLIARLARDGAIRSELTQAQAVDRAWILTGLDTYMNATLGCGWSPADYSTWLAETLSQQLLEPAGNSDKG